MKKKALMRSFVTLSLLGLLLSTQARADWDVLKTPHFTCFYPEGYKWEATQSLSNLEYYREDVVKLTGNREIGNLPVVIEDVGMLTNGFADPTFKNIHLFTHPPQSLTTLGVSENWYRQVGVHEYTHIAHLTKTSGVPEFLNTIFGPICQPNNCSPGWIGEGITVFAESQPSPYEGRLNDGAFDAVVKANIKEGRFPSICEATYPTIDFPGWGGMYLYGSEFFKYLAEKYGQEKFSRFFEATGSSLLTLWIGNIFPGLGIDRAAKEVYGKSFPQLFSEWQNSIDAASWKIDGEQLTEQGWFVYQPILVQDKLYYIRDYPKKTGAFSEFYFVEIVERDITTQKEKVVVSTTSEFVGGLERSGDKLYYAVKEVKKGYANSAIIGFGAYAILHEKDLSSGQDRVLFEDEIRDFAMPPGGEIIYARDRKHTFGSELWVWSANEGKKQILSSDYLISEVLALKEGKIAVVARGDWENWNIYLLDLNSKKFSPITETPFAEYTISCSRNKLFFSANYEKAYSIYAYDLADEKLSKLTGTGFACFPVFDERNNELYFVGLNSSGLDLYKKKIEGFDEFLVKNYPKSTPPVFPELKAEKGGRLDHLKTLLPKFHIPYPVGIFLGGQDAVGENLYGINCWREERKSELSLFYGCLRFKPSILFLQYESDDEATLGWWYPLRMRISQPLSIWIGLEGREFNKFKRKEVSPSISFSLNFPKTKVEVSADYYLERKKLLGSTIDREGMELDFWLSRYLKDSELDFSLSGVYDPDNPKKTDLDIRGYEDSLKSKKGVAVSLEYSRPWLKIRKGLWNPNIFLEDLCLSVFADAAFSKEKTRFSGGVELQQEAGAFFWLGFTPTLGLAYNKEGEGTVYLQVGF